MESQKVALITGGSDGIGKGVAEKLLNEGWYVEIVTRSHQKCKDAVEELKRKTNQNSIAFIAADLSNLT